MKNFLLLVFCFLVVNEFKCKVILKCEEEFKNKEIEIKKCIINLKV